MCGVCGDMAAKEQTFRRHYGVICCEACKCFFRRTVQMNRDYKCRFGGACSIGRTPLNMKQVCQACRFSECIKAGMKLDCEWGCGLWQGGWGWVRCGRGCEAGGGGGAQSRTIDN